MGTSLEQAISTVVRQYPGSTARELSAVLRRQGWAVHKRDINPLLYRESGKFRHDGGYVPRWSVVGATAPAADPGRSARTDQVRARRSDVDRLYQRLDLLDQAPVEAASSPPPTPLPAALPAASAPASARTALAAPTAWELTLLPWQREALSGWYSAGGRGVVEAVTGTGKTHLGLELASQMARRGGRSTVLVPTVVLQDQWARKFREFCRRDLRIARVGGGFHEDPAQADVTIAVMNTAARQDLAIGAPERNLLIADEVHRYGAEQMQQALRAGYDLRLGLTATYERDSDEGIAEILDPYFERVVMSYGYDRAVPEDVVARFELLFLGVTLGPDDQEQYDRLSRTVSRTRQVLVSAGATPRDLQRNLSRFYAMGGYIQEAVKGYESSTRARRHLLANTTSKTSAVFELADTLERCRGAVVFTQTIESAEAAAEELRARGVVSASVHSEMPQVERMANIHALEDESVRVLCAPKVLDEGLDIPNIDIGVVLAASRTKRQMIQRLGRVIRKKDDGRWARFLVVYARDTVEDPEHGAHGAFLELVRGAAADETILPMWDRHEVVQRLWPSPPPEPPGNPALAAIVRRTYATLRDRNQAPEDSAPGSRVTPLQPTVTNPADHRPAAAAPAELWPTPPRSSSGPPAGLAGSDGTSRQPAAGSQPQVPRRDAIPQSDKCWNCKSDIDADGSCECMKHPHPNESRQSATRQGDSTQSSRQLSRPPATSPGFNSAATDSDDRSDSTLVEELQGTTDALEVHHASALAAAASQSSFGVYVEVPGQPIADARQVGQLMRLRIKPHVDVILHTSGPDAPALERQLADILSFRPTVSLTRRLLSGETVIKAHESQQRAVPTRRAAPKEPETSPATHYWCSACLSVMSHPGGCMCSQR